ncbi:MAG: hypothetical protein EOP04_31705 [Proteobacteria bacterium]|nr:MAG: hypothetical protein EOP04_31705 [Pseudomonadota bacterium]
MQTSQLVGIWKLESSAGKLPAEHNVKTGVIKFKADGTFVDATEVLSPVPGFVPERIHRFKGTWKLDENVLEKTFPEGTFPKESFPDGPFHAVTHRNVVAINSDTLEIAAIQYDRKIEKEFIGIFVYKRVNTS